jgi:hypothetical protein
MLKRGLTVLALTVGICIGVATSASATITDVQTRNNTASARYDSSVDTFTVWDNARDSDSYSKLFVTNVDKGSQRTYSYGWVGGGASSKKFGIPSGYSSGDQIRFFVCETSSFTGKALSCSATKTAYI